ncbi:hypothetical protein E2320_005756 [Naja naja]|nr:hypothetical protein E2320_005756 [Naja naja]
MDRRPRGIHWEEASVLCQVEPVGRWFEAWRRRNIHNQDHYSVLGLGQLRYKASQKQIKAAHKAMVLKHHPDKRKAAGEQIGEGDNDYFTCITKDPMKRRAFNSIDPTFDNTVPSKSEAKENFFEVFAPVFERNARWSNKKNVPKLGDMSSSFDEVDAFYSFWYNFDSWREFSYLDEEEKEKAECRDERRWIEKQNRAGRSLRKKEEMNRIRTLVDNSYSCDPRIKKFKEEERAKKEAEKKAKVEAKRKEQEEKERQRQAELEMARLAKEKEEEEARQQTLLMKKEKDIQKKAIKKERQKLRTTCKNWNYFSDNEAESVKMMEEVEKLCDRLELASLQCLNEALTSTTKDEGKAAVLKQIEQVNEQVRREKEEAEARMRQATKSSEKSTSGSVGGSKNWSEDDLQLLIKAMGSYCQLHEFALYHRDKTNGERCYQQSKEPPETWYRYLYPHQKDDINKKAFDKFKKEHGVIPQADSAAPSERFEVSFTDATPWTTEEQKLLEQALKTYPVNTPERWEKIAASVPGRSKKDCMKRYKELVEMVKAKKAAQEQVVNAAKTKK